MIRLHPKLQDLFKIVDERLLCPFCKMSMKNLDPYFYHCNCRNGTGIKYEFNGERSGFNAFSFSFKMNRGRIWVSAWLPTETTSLTFVKKGIQTTIKVPTTDFPWLDLQQMREKVSTLFIFA